MYDDRWKKLNDLFEAAVAQDAADRHDFVLAACAGDEVLLEEASRLLRAHERAPLALGTSVFTATVQTLVAGDEPAAGARFGPYRAVREIGRGGMGVVYLAERVDEQFDKRVAIKLMKRGVDTDAVLRLFRHERQVLAGLDHHNITRLLDGGTAEDGRPYFVMEYVEGTPIHEYCDANALSITDRLRLFRSVCAAVSYAHHHLVVHRDLKPSNIVVTASGDPKLLDFGIAKLLDAERDGAVTAFAGARLMTPEYASPEQLEGHAITTLTDVYSLGVVLYELLAGRRAFAPAARVDAGGGWIATRDDVARPSSVVARGGTTPGGEDVSPQQIAALRRTSADRLRRRLRGDLDTIVLKAMHVEPARRYQSAEQLSEDIQRHLDGLPVQGRRDTFAYRAAKFVRRNRVAVAAAVIVILSLAAGIVATERQANRARAAQARAERRFNDVRKLANMVLFDYHDLIQDLPGATRVRERLVKDALAYLDSLAAESGDDPALQRDLAAAYDRVGDVLGRPWGPNLGDPRAAMENYRKGLRIREALVAADPRDVQNRRDLAESHRSIGWLETGQAGGGLEHLRRAIALYRELTAEQPTNTEIRRGLARAHNELASALEDRGDLAGALENLRGAVQLLDELSAADPADRKLRRSLSIAYENTARSLFLSGEVAAALDFNARARDLRAKLAAEEPASADFRRLLAISYQNDGDFRDRAGDRRGALESFRRKIAIDDELLAADPANVQAHGDFGYSLHRLADLLALLGEYAQALSYYRRSADVFGKLSATAANDVGARLRVALSLAAMAKVTATLGDRAAALAHCRETLRLPLDIADDPTNAHHRRTRAEVYTNLADAYLTLATSPATPVREVPQHWSEAREMLRRSLQILEDMRARGILSATDSGKRDEIVRELARCDAMLATMRGPDG